MKSVVNIFIAIGIAGSFFSSCKKEWYEAKPDDRTVTFDKLNDFEQLLDNNLMFEGSPALGEIASDGHYISESGWRTLEGMQDDASNTQRNAYTWSNQWHYRNVSDYELAYARIAYCNFVLQGLDKLHDLSADERRKMREVRGNALFHRAKNNFDLCQLYAQPYVNGNDNSTLGIVLEKMADDPSEPSVQSTVKKCYEEIIDDLKASLDGLPLKPAYLTRGSRKAAFVLLARTCLVMQDYEQAGIYADSCLRYEIQLMDYNTIPADTAKLGMFNKEVLFYSQMISYQVISSLSYIEPELYAMYEPADLRKSRFFVQNANGTVTFKGAYSDNKMYNFSGLAADEVYLIRAECYARTGNTTEAQKYLNELLQKRWDKNVVYTPVSLDAAATLKKILVERKKELLMRGLRWSDLRRLNQETIKRPTGPYELGPNSRYKYTFPIPANVLELGPLLKQHPGW